jgi:hypothetical protein
VGIGTLTHKIISGSSRVEINPRRRIPILNIVI